MRTLDLFAGCGGLSLGFQNAGYQLVAAYDHWEPAIQVYQDNFSHPIFSVDLAQLDAATLQEYQADMIIGGPPCQDFSSAGKRDETLGRADLTYRFGEMVVQIQPSWFVMENVERIINSAVLKQTKDLLIQAGYALTETVLDASYCGVPQKRKRFFLIGEYEGIPNALRAYLEKNQSIQPMTVYDYLGDSLGIKTYYRHPRSYQRRGIFSIYEPSPTVRGVNRPVPKTYQKHKNDAGEVDDKLRALTTKERSLIQTFPSDFKLKGTKTNLEQMIGNAVPVKLAEFVARAILNYQQDQMTGTIVEPSPIQLPLF